MDREKFIELTVSMLYGEITEADRQQLNEWLENHPDQQKEVEELSKVHHLLNGLKEEEISTIETPVHLPVVSSKTNASTRWKRWVAAAAVFVIFLGVIATQGFVIQFGEVRMVFGSVPSLKNDQEIRNEIMESYLPVMEKLVQTVEQVKTSGELTAERLDSLERSMQMLALYYKTERKQNNQKIERYMIGLAREVDKRLNHIYAVASNSPERHDNKTVNNDG